MSAGAGATAGATSSPDALYYEAWACYHGAASPDPDRAQALLRTVLYQRPRVAARTRALCALLLGRIQYDVGSAADRKDADRWYESGATALALQLASHIAAVRDADDAADADAALAAEDMAAGGVVVAGDTKAAAAAAAKEAADKQVAAVAAAAAAPVAVAATATAAAANDAKADAKAAPAVASDEPATDISDAEALCALAQCLASGRGADRDPKLAAALCERAVEVAQLAVDAAGGTRAPLTLVAALAHAEVLLGTLYGTGVGFGLSVKNALRQWTAATTRWDAAVKAAAAPTAGASAGATAAAATAADAKDDHGTAAQPLWFAPVLTVSKVSAAFLSNALVQRHVRFLRVSEDIELSAELPKPAAVPAGGAAARTPAALAAAGAAAVASTSGVSASSATAAAVPDSATTAGQLAAFGASLVTLDLGSRASVTAKALVMALTPLRELRVLRVADLTPRSLGGGDYAPFALPPKLTHLLLHDNSAPGANPALLTRLLSPAATPAPDAGALVVTAPALMERLLTLDLSHCRSITDASLAVVASLPRLQHLDLRHCRLLTVATARALGSSGTLGKSLTALNLYDAEGLLCDDSVVHLAGLGSLQALNVATVPPVDDDGKPTLGRLTDDGLCSGLRLATKLTALDLSFSAVSSAGLRKLLGGMRQLRALYLCGCQNVTDDALDALAGVRDTIELLDFAVCRKLTGNPPSAVAATATATATAAPAGAVSATGTAAPNAAAPPAADVAPAAAPAAAGATDAQLTTPGAAAGTAAAASDATAVPDSFGARKAAALAALSAVGPTGLHGAKRLTSLTVGSCPEWRALGSGFVECTALRALAVGASLIGDAQLRYLPDSGALTQLNVSCCNQLTDAGLTLLAQRVGRGLRTLDLSACHNITDTGVSALGTHCPRLRRLNVQNVELSGVAFVALGRGCPALEHLTWRGSAHDRGLAYLCGVVPPPEPRDVDADADADADPSPASSAAAAASLATAVLGADGKDVGDGLRRTLRVLDVGNSRDLTLHGVQHLPRIVRLQSLALDECFALTDAAVVTALTRLNPRRLELLDLRGCLLLAPSGRALLSAALPACKSLYFPRNRPEDIARHARELKEQALKERARKENQRVVAQAAFNVQQQALQELAAKALAEQQQNGGATGATPPK